MTGANEARQAINDCWNRIGVRGDHSCAQLREHSHCRNCEVYADAARSIMQRALPSAYQHDWAEQLSHQEQTTQATDQAALVFRVGCEWLALPARLSLSIAETSMP